MNSDSRYEEGDNVEHAVKAYGIRHTPISVRTEGFLGNLRKMVVHHDAPVYTISYYAHWLLMEAISARHYRISISGTGSDEMFTGYYDHHLQYLHDVRPDTALHATSAQAWSRHIQPIARNPFLKDAEAFIKNPGLRDHLYLDKELFLSFLKPSWNEPFEEERYTNELLRNRMLNEMFHESVPPILHEDDINAMAFSLENRSPFLDRDLFEFCFRIPTRHLIRDAYTKVLLRDAMRGIVPDQILDARRKVGFNVPIFSYLDIHDSLVHNCLLEDSPVFDLIRREKVAAMLDRDDLPNSESLFLFYFICTKFFLEAFETSAIAAN
jgi:asparagine synthase (glutamine-hydrolysing)